MAVTQEVLKLDADVVDAARKRYQRLGFDQVDDLVSAAVREYLKKRELEEKDASMCRAAADQRYLQVLREISEDFKYVDAENLPPEY